MASEGSGVSQVDKFPSLISASSRTAPVTGARWYVVQTQPHAEFRAIANLERQAYEVFCPRIAKTVRHARKVKRVMAPLFPGYVFIQFDASSDPWRSVNGTFGVSRLVAHGDVPQAVPRGVVEAIQAHMQDDGVIDWSRSFKVGQAVRIADGPFAELVGTLQQLDALGRVRVLLDLLGRSVSVALHCEALAVAV